MANKKIKLYKVNSDGTLDKESQLLPETNIESVQGLNEELSGKIGTDDYLNNYKYDKIEKEVPGEIVDGETYTLPKEYDNDWVSSIIETVQDDNLFVYGASDEPNKDAILFSVMGLAAFLNLDNENKVVYDYVPKANPLVQVPGWYSVDTSQEQPIFTPYTGDINITIDTNYIVEGQEEVLSKVLAIQPQIIEEDRTLKQKNEDIKNWVYDRKEHKEMIYGFKDGVNYKFNFNSSEYLDKFSQFTPYPNQTYIYGYNGDETLDYNCSIYSTSVYGSTFRIVVDGITYWFIIDVNNEKLGTWRKGSSLDSEAYTDEELEDITFVLDLTKVPQDYAAFTKEVLLDLEGNPVDELVDGTTYKINFDVRDYQDIFDWYSDNGRTVSGTFDWYIYGDNTVGVNSICYYATGSLGSLYISLPNYTYYYLCPAIGTYYPGRWYKSSEIRPSNLRTPEELQDVEFTMVRNAIVDEELLRVITTNVDGTPIEEDREETIIEITKIDDKFNEPLKDKIYDSFNKTIEVVEDIADDTEYTFKNDMRFNEQDNYLFEDFEDLGSNTAIYLDETNNISIVYSIEGGKGWSDNYLEYYDGNNYYKYIIADTWNEVFRNEWYEVPKNGITIYTNYILNKDILKRMINLPSHEEIIIVNQTLEEKNDDLPNWKYGTKEGIFDVPNWVTDASYSGRLTIYNEEDVCSVACIYDNDGISYELYDEVNHIGYTIFNYTRIGEEDEEYSANTWYSFSLTDESAPLEKCDTPNIILDKNYAYPFYLELFNAFYGLRPVTLKEEIDAIREEINMPLKDRIYDNSGDLVDGEEYKLKEDYTDFFDKYAHGQSTLIYGENDSPTPSPTPILADEVTAKGGEPIDLPAPDIEVPTNNPTILGIYLYTDSTPIIKDGLTRDGAIQYDGDLPAPDVPVFGGASIDVYTSQGTITFNQGGDGWYYNSNKIPTEELPTLILDSSLIQNEEMLKDFIGGSSITLEQKLGSFKDWTYEDHPAILVDGEDYPLLNTYSDDFFTKYEDLFVSGGGTTIYTTGGMGQELDLVNFEAGEVLTFKLIVFRDINTNPSTCVAYTKVPEGLMGINDGWYLAEWSEELNGWSLVTPPTTTTNPTLTQLNNNFIVTDMEDVLKDILGIVGSVTTVDDKFNEPLKDKTYDYESGELVDGGSYNFEETFTLSDTSNGSLYNNSSSSVVGDVYSIEINNGRVLVMVNPEPGEMSSPFSYNLSTNEWEDDVYQYLPTLVLNASAVNVSREDDLKAIFGLNNKAVTLEEKLNSILPPVDTTTQGTYILKAVVDGSGNVTYSWVLETV